VKYGISKYWNKRRNYCLTNGVLKSRNYSSKFLEEALTQLNQSALEILSPELVSTISGHIRLSAYAPKIEMIAN